MNKTVLTLLSVLLFSSLSASVVAADGATDCKVVYGGGQTCVSSPSTQLKISEPQFEVKKYVKNPATQAYVKNLSISDPKYKAGDEVTFKLTVKNTASTELTNIIVKDTFPVGVDFGGGAGNYDFKRRTLSLSIDKLAGNESRDLYVNGNISKDYKFENGKNVACVTNTSAVYASNKTVNDKSQFCIEKPGSANADKVVAATTVAPTNAPSTTKGGLSVYPPTNATTTPPTGPEEWSLIGLIPTAISGLILRRKTK